MSGGIRFITFAELARDCASIPVPGDVAAVVGIPRSGMLAATLIATRLHLPLGMVGSGKVHGGSRMAELPARGKGRVLLVDDSALTGDSMRHAKDRLVRSGVRAADIVTCAVYVAPEGASACDIAGERTSRNRFFEWNMWNSWATSRLMSDMDGVICRDPVAFDDDGPLYEADLRSAPPKYLPRRPVRAIVTNRLDRWRGVTEDWLRRHGAESSSLVMRPERTAAERRANGHPADFKAERYREDPEAWLFVESHDIHAERIAAVSGRPVLSVESASIFQKETP